MNAAIKYGPRFDPHFKWPAPAKFITEAEWESALAGESAALEEAAELRRRLQCIDGDMWIWSGDDTDALASMSDEMAVKLLAHDIRQLVGDAVAKTNVRWMVRLERLRKFASDPDHLYLWDEAIAIIEGKDNE
jgi:hypothetical protein